MLFGVDLDVPQGAVVTLLGRNGMGKTTTLRSIFGLLALRGGEIRLLRAASTQWPPTRSLG